MKKILHLLKRKSDLLLRLLPLIMFACPLLLLYFLNPMDPFLGLSARESFEGMWKGRTFQLFFIWLIVLELILGWESLQKNKLGKLVSARTIFLVATLSLPTLYVIACNYLGLNGIIAYWAINNGIPFANSMPLAIEYLVFAAFFVFFIFLFFGLKGIKSFSVPAFFLAFVGIIYTIDNIFPYGQFTPFQIFVPTTTSLASIILNWMGFTTDISYSQDTLHGYTPILTATDPNNLHIISGVLQHPSATFSIAWPCAGIESFIIFTVVFLLFLKRMPIGLKGKVGYFAFGVVVTYIINAYRIVSIFTTAMVFGENSIQVQNVHFYYGPLYAISWIVSYPLIIMGAQFFWHKYRKRKSVTNEVPITLLNSA